MRKMNIIRHVIILMLLVDLLLVVMGCKSYMEWYYTTLPGGKEQHDRQLAEINERNRNSSSSNSSSFKFDLTYYEWPDGCLTYQYDMHYETRGTIITHRNDNASVNKQINDFNKYVKQYNAVQYINGRQYYKGTYVYSVEKSSYFNPGNQTWTSNGVTSGDPGGTYYVYVCRIWQL